MEVHITICNGDGSEKELSACVALLCWQGHSRCSWEVDTAKVLKARRGVPGIIIEVNGKHIANDYWGLLEFIKREGLVKV